MKHHKQYRKIKTRRSYVVDSKGLKWFSPTIDDNKAYFMLLPLNNRKCFISNCDNISTNYLLDPDNKMIGLYCFDCGVNLQQSFDIRHRSRLEGKR